MERLPVNSEYSPIELSIHLARYACVKQFASNKKILDFACGEGYGASFLKKWGAKQVVGIDISEQAIAAANKHFKEPGVQFIAGGIDDLQEKFDLIVCVETIEHVEDPRKLIENLRNLSHKETRFIFTCPNDYYYYGRGQSINPYHKTTFSYFDFRQLIEDYFESPTWLFGAPLSGFGCFPVSEPTIGKDSIVEAATGVMETTFIGVPGPRGISRLTPSSSLFYVAVWPPIEQDHVVSAGFGANSDYRIPELSSASKSVRAGQIRRIAFVVDRPGWAFDNIAHCLKPHLSGRYEADIFYISDYAQDIAKLFANLFINNTYDNIHFMWREVYFNFIRNKAILEKVYKISQMTVEKFAERLSGPVVTATVYDHLFLNDEEIQERQQCFGVLDGYSTSSEILSRTYGQCYSSPPTEVTEDGVDLDLFSPRSLDRFTRQDDGALIVGWAGNSAWAKSKFDGDPKGFHTVLLPAIEKLQAEGLDVVGRFADRAVEWRPRHAMPQYYAELDVLVCASEVEGTPNPVLEAMACGVPIISTNVGIVESVFGRKQSDFILSERTHKQLANKLRLLHANRDKLRSLSNENLESIRGWSWKAKVPKWLRLFREAETRHASSIRMKEITFCRMTLDATFDHDLAQLRQANGKLRDKVATSERDLVNAEAKHSAELDAMSAEAKEAENKKAERDEYIRNLEQYVEILETRNKEVEAEVEGLRQRRSADKRKRKNQIFRGAE